MDRRRPLASVLACFLLSSSPLLPAQAEEASRVLRIADFGGSALAQNERTALQNLVTSYVMELKAFRVTDSSGQELALKEAETAIELGQSPELKPLVADYILSARAEELGSLLVFTMEVTKASNGEKKSVADSFPSVNDLILASRRLTRSLFDSQGAGLGTSAENASESPPSAAAEAPGAQAAVGPRSALPSLEIVAGSWKGDKSVDRITLFPDGKGFALLSSGFRMRLRASVSGRTVVVEQAESNSANFYRAPNLSAKAARLVAQQARPWRWIFSLSTDGSSLVGVKETVFVTVTEKGQVSVDNNYVRPAQWTRLYR